jgi:hypothetical protein
MVPKTVNISISTKTLSHTSLFVTININLNKISSLSHFNLKFLNLNLFYFIFIVICILSHFISLTYNFNHVSWPNGSVRSSNYLLHMIVVTLDDGHQEGPKHVVWINAVKSETQIRCVRWFIWLCVLTKVFTSHNMINKLVIILPTHACSICGKIKQYTFKIICNSLSCRHLLKCINSNFLTLEPLIVAVS